MKTWAEIKESINQVKILKSHTMVKVYFERNGYAEEIGTFVSEETYIQLLPILEKMAKEEGFDKVTESMIDAEYSQKNPRIVKVSTTAFEEEDFILMTSLNDNQIAEVITPIVNVERNGEDFYDNDVLVFALKDKYPKELVEQYSVDMDKLSV